MGILEKGTYKNTMIKYIFISTPLSCSKINAQTMIGKTDEAEVGASCKQANWGGCMIYKYNAFTFKKDTVIVSAD